MTDKSKTLKRKAEHIDICLTKRVDSNEASTGFEDVYLIHKPLPEVDFEEISLETKFLSHTLSAPLIVDAISGGPEEAEKINSSIAEAVEELGLGMVVGSQRIALESEETVKTFKIARRKAPNAFISANIGVQQIRGEDGVRVAEKCIEMIDADALTIHLNPLQEVLQQEGDKHFKGCLKAIERVVDRVSKPVIVKETGSGIDWITAKRLEEIGVSAINVAGVGGTSWAAVEYYRNLKSGNRILIEASKAFWNWGLPTAFAVYSVSRVVRIPVIASGGIRSGIDVAKAIALGASLSAMAKPVLARAVKGYKQVKEFLEGVIYQVKMALLLTGSKRVRDLKSANYLLAGRLRELIDSWRSKAIV